MGTAFLWGAFESPAARAAPDAPCGPGWRGQAILDTDSLAGWTVESDAGSSGSLALVSGPGGAGSAVELRWELAAGAWVQARRRFSTPVDLSRFDVLGLDLRGSPGPGNRVSIMFRDTRGVFFGLDQDGLDALDRWARNLIFPRGMFYRFFGSPGEIDWSRIESFFLVVKRPGAGEGGGSGRLALGALRGDRAAEWPRQAAYEPPRPEPRAAARALGYLLGQQQPTGLLVSWKEEPRPLAHLYDQALALLAFTRAGRWEGGRATDPPSRAADRLVSFLLAEQSAEGSWPRTWDPRTGAPLSLNDWVGDQAWCVFALAAYAKRSGSPAAGSVVRGGAGWLADRVATDGSVVASTEGTIDTWWALMATGRLDAADRVRDRLIGAHWDEELGYFWRGRTEVPDRSVALDTATFGSELLRHPRVGLPERGHAALSFVRRALASRDASGRLCGLDGQGPLGIWNEGVAQYASAGGEGSEELLDMLLSVQEGRADGSLPGSPEDISGTGYGWLTTWSGVAPTAWLYFAATGSPYLMAGRDGFEPFVRGDADRDGVLSIGDAVGILGSLFLGGSLRCREAAEVNGDGEIDLSDAIWVLQFLFIGGVGPPGHPYPECGAPERYIFGCRESECARK